MILIVGGAGYIGSHITKMLNQKGYETVVFDNLSKGHIEFIKWGNFILGDISDQYQLDLIFKNYSIDAVFHFSAFINVGESVKEPLKYYLNNVSSTLTLLKTMRKYNVKYFIFSSTAAVYGNPEYIPIKENAKLMPINPYGKSKLFVEEILQDLEQAYGINYAILRYFNAAGADPDGDIGEWHEPETHLIPLILDAAIGKREDIKIFGTDYPTPDGTCIRDYIHVNDLADAHIKALEYIMNENKSLILNLGNGNGFSVREVIEYSKEITGIDFKVIETDRREGDPAVLVASSDLAKNILGWKPQFTDIRDIIKTAWNWHKILYKKYKN